MLLKEQDIIKCMFMMILTAGAQADEMPAAPAASVLSKAHGDI